MEISGTPVPDKRSGFFSGDFELSDAFDEDTEQVIHFYTLEVHDVVAPAVQDVVMSPQATKAGFICSSDVVYTNVSREPYIDLTGTVVSNIRFTTQLDFAIYPIGSPEAMSVRLHDVKLLILFGSRDWNEAVRSRCVTVGVDTSFYRNLMYDQEDLLKRLNNVPVIGGEPTQPELSVSPRGYLVVGSKFAVHTRLIQDSETAGQVFHELSQEVDRSAAAFSRPKLVGFVFGAFGSLQRHKNHYMNASAWSKLQNAFPYTQFTGCSTVSIYTGNYPFTEFHNRTLVSIVIIEK